ncbi:MAG: N-acetylmuramoyl-L-alanine amidase [Actinomycetota bacterium]
MVSEPGAGPVGRLRAGVLVPFEAIEGEWARVETPCALSRWMRLDEAVRLASAQVVLDPGHGGGETGAVGPGGLQEKDVNLQVASRAARVLNGRGVPTVLTREQDYRATLAFRAAFAEVADSEVFVSIHHNADPDGPMERPGTETYYQYRSTESKRLAGLIHEETVDRLSGLSAEWVGDTDAGAKWRLNSRGTDYYGLLRLTAQAGVPSVLAELSFISNSAEEELLRREDVIDLEAQAVAGGVLRYLDTEDPGSGFSTPYPRRQPAGPGGGTSGCTDPD